MKLRQCLRDLNTTTANTVGTIFFNVARVTCFTYNKTCHHTRQRFDEGMDQSTLDQKLLSFWTMYIKKDD
ncbi:unnamed protein product [Timema podura]|uniref:phospholipase A2 n=1 Tax=Timema podura TaxID=61482 RepID=A0ABN7PCS6_TIMPD|nr:unnamed protein product [Timema podura]